MKSPPEGRRERRCGGPCGPADRRGRTRPRAARSRGPADGRAGSWRAGLRPRAAVLARAARHRSHRLRRHRARQLPCPDSTPPQARAHRRRPWRRVSSDEQPRRLDWTAGLSTATAHPRKVTPAEADVARADAAAGRSTVTSPATWRLTVAPRRTTARPATVPSPCRLRHARHAARSRNLRTYANKRAAPSPHLRRLTRDLRLRIVTAASLTDLTPCAISSTIESFLGYTETGT